jgi:hypothetical protein
MGLAASQSRYLSLASRQSDLEYQAQQVNQQRMILSTQTESLLNTIATLESDTTAYDQISAKVEALHQKDVRLELNLKNIDTYHNTVQTEIDAVKKVIDKGVDATFKTFA